MGSASENVCHYNNVGFCKYGNTCKRKHYEELCESKYCKEGNCKKRHPRDCFFYQVYGRCKFGEFCRFRHALPDNIEKIVQLEKKLLDMESKLNQQSVFINILRDELDKSFDVLEISRNTESDETKTKELEGKVNILEVDNLIVANAFDDVEKATRLLIQQVKILWSVSCECDVCGFCYDDPLELIQHKKKHTRGYTTT